MTVYTFTPDGHSYAGSVKWKVSLPGGHFIGHVAAIPGKRGNTWSAVGPQRSFSQGGHPNREAAARWLESVHTGIEENKCLHEDTEVLNPTRHRFAPEIIACCDCGAQLEADGDGSLQEVTR